MGYTSGKRLKKLNKGGEELREEKRLYHVGVTRARDSVFVVGGLFGSDWSPVLTLSIILLPTTYDMREVEREFYEYSQRFDTNPSEDNMDTLLDAFGRLRAELLVEV
jgi:superfamily I DNA/RNA helicase